MLTAQQLAVIKQTVPVLQEGGEALTRHFYARMFRENPEVRAFFNPAHQQAGTQQKALAAAICAYAQHIENPAVLAGAVELIAQKHASLGILAQHYPIVGKNLLASIQEVLGDAATPEIIDAWGAAYGVLADILVNREQQIHSDHQHQHGWTGFKRFVVQQTEAESDNIRSIYLVPEDGKPLQAHQPGQYITVRLSPDGNQPVMRNYSLSNRPGAGHFRISVKREKAIENGAPDGICSNYIHDRIRVGDVLEVAPPCGEFTLKTAEPAQRPLVFIAGGVGITPLLSMLYAALDSQPGREIHFVQCALNGALRPFSAELHQLQRDFPNLKTHVRFSAPQASDRLGETHDSEGFVDSALVEQVVGNRTAEFYLCGPAPMLKHVWQLLNRLGFDAGHIHYEFFGPAGDLAA